MADVNYVLECYNAMSCQNFSMLDFRKGKLKGLHIPEQRRALEEKCGVDLVNSVFGEPTHLEKAEIMFLEIAEGKVTKEEKYEYLIQISNELSEACRCKINRENIYIFSKWLDLNSMVPFKRPIFKESMLDHLTSGGLIEPENIRLKKDYIPVEVLKRWKKWIFSKEGDLPRKKGLEAVFEQVYISLREIFEEIKAAY